MRKVGWTLCGWSSVLCFLSVTHLFPLNLTIFFDRIKFDKSFRRMSWVQLPLRLILSCWRSKWIINFRNFVNHTALSLIWLNIFLRYPFRRTVLHHSCQKRLSLLLLTLNQWGSLLYGRDWWFQRNISSLLTLRNRRFRRPYASITLLACFGLVHRIFWPCTFSILFQLFIRLFLLWGLRSH